MKRKTSPSEDVIVPAEVLASADPDAAKVYYVHDRVKAVTACVVCGSETTESGGDERLCWVCRRLKISAWRDSEPMPAQE